MGVIKHFHLSLISNKAYLHCHLLRLQTTLIKIYWITTERLKGLNHWGYLIYIDNFRLLQDDSDLQFFSVCTSVSASCRCRLPDFYRLLAFVAKAKLRTNGLKLDFFSTGSPPKAEYSSFEKKESAQSTLSLAPLTGCKKMDCNNNCWPSGQWTVKEQFLGVQPLDSHLWNILQSCQLSGKDNCTMGGQKSFTTH